MLAKAGLDGVPVHLANAVRTAVVLAVTMVILVPSGELQRSSALTGRVWSDPGTPLADDWDRGDR